MNLISCTDDCIYQKEGECTLDRAVSNGNSGSRSLCAYYIPKCRAEERYDPDFTKAPRQ